MMKARTNECEAAAGMALGVAGVATLLLATAFTGVTADTNSDDVTALNTFYTTLNSPSQLTNWVSQNGDPCGQSWLGITCAGSRVITIKVPGMGLKGTLGYNMNLLTALSELDTSNNNLGGSDIPYNLPPNLERLNLEKNSFTGTLPYSISQMDALKYLNLGHNQLSDINVMFNQLTNLTALDLSYNSFSVTLPESFNSLTSLSTLYLQNNQFTGTIDVLTNLPLTDLNVANNQFSGSIPDKLKSISNLQTSGNSFSNSPAPAASTPPNTPPPLRPFTTGIPSHSNNSPSSGSDTDNGGGRAGGRVGSGGKSSKVGGGTVAGIVISLVVVVALGAFFLIKRKSMRHQQGGDPEKNDYLSPLASGKIKQLRPIRSVSLSPTGKENNVSMNLKAPSKIELHTSFDENDPTNKPATKKINLSSIRATAYTVADLQVATESFSAHNQIGEGSFGHVYRAQLSDQKVLAVKKINFSALTNHPSDFFIELVAKIAKLNHPNLSELDGYCSEHGQCLLVYEFYTNGSLHDFLHLLDGYSKPLSWNTRVKIALGSARALEYLHETCSPSIIHKNFKSSNILLDNELNPHISDCGFADLIPNQELQESDDNSGYRAPEVTMFGQYSQKSDVYSFGVVMLELLTGRKAFDSSQPRSQQSLVRWATPQLYDIDSLDQMVDPALEGLYPAKSLSRFADAIALCVQPEPEFRPPMSEVVQSLVRLVQRSGMGSSDYTF
ncbi:protein STRUBBELIG-RECEPTOR FAMILY 7-like isoform X2 [Phragmites australis]|uniref:protein STRUBBELIG-RECEPTOR FAMILY 7-like isoform X2 n=1 Tax=Phragmites australis TaxID=29695 RepID=UPI002D774C41|nr:protein STRUBBELIG-RECEPTOR FAMILY 7-like isoform X2 [Phragmites australis]